MRALIKMEEGRYVVGWQVKTRGNDEEYPTFRLADGTLISVAKDRIEQVLSDDD